MNIVYPLVSRAELPTRRADILQIAGLRYFKTGRASKLSKWDIRSSIRRISASCSRLHFLPPEPMGPYVLILTSGRRIGGSICAVIAKKIHNYNPSIAISYLTGEFR